jgi:hypothetical protein
MTESFPLDPVAFLESLIDPETGKPFALNDAERRFIAEAFRTRPDGRLLYSELVYSCPKKSGKTTFAGMLVLYVTLVLGGKFGEGVCLANDYEQAAGRVFAMIKRIIAATPWLKASACPGGGFFFFATIGWGAPSNALNKPA